MKFRVVIGIFISCVLLKTASVDATPLRLTVQPKGTNQVELTFGPVVPGVSYEVLVRTNGPEGHWMTFSEYFGGSNTTVTAVCDLGGIPGLRQNTLHSWKFVAGRWDDPLGDELPPLYKELVLRIDPFASGDPYGNQMGDGWNNLQKLQNNMDPFRAYPPPAPQSSVAFYQGTNDVRHGRAVLTWRVFNGPVPDYFLIERANRTMRPVTNDMRFQRTPPFGPNGRFPTNLPPNFRPMNGRPGFPRENPMVTGPYEVVARAPGQAGLSEYRYIDPNVDTFFQPLYRIQPHYTPPLRAVLHQVDTTEIRKTIVSVVAQQTTNGYALTVPHPVPYASYLLLVRDKIDPHWRASGYFASGTNREPVYLHVDKQGMMHEGQSPIAMPEVKFLPDVVKPEFTAGWGEDSDGDGLPDVYEVLVTHTEPDNADTGDTGILDGYKEMTSDGWNNLEKFRRRVDPLQPAQPPPTVELRQPTESEIMKSVMPKTDLSCDLQIEVRTNGATNYQPIEQVPWMVSKIMNFRQPNDRKNFDLRISWRFADPKANQYENNSFGRGEASFQALESLVAKASLQLAESFKANLAANPPLSPTALSNTMAAIEHAYRQGEMEKGLAMAEMMTLSDNQSQDFYGRVIDQHGQPVVGADVSININLSFGQGGTQKTKTDASGNFQFTGIRGESVSVTPEKSGYQIEGHGLGLHGRGGPESNPNHRAIYTMWKLKGPEPMIHDSERYRVKSDSRIYTVDLLSKKLVEGTNDPGDLLIQFQRPAQVKPHENFEWSFTLTPLGGGVIEVTNEDYLNEAPAKGYRPQYRLDMTPANPKWSGWNGEATFYLKSRNGKAYGHFHIRLDPVDRDGSSMEIESYVNPAGSRNLEFDPDKQTEYKSPQAAVTSPTPVVPKKLRVASTNASGQVVSWGSIVLPLVQPGTRFIAVAAGGEHSLALKADGTVVAWGRNLSGESTVPEGLSNVIAIAAGGRSNSGFSVALRRDGTIVAWGDNAHLQTSVSNGLNNVVAITAGTEHCLAIKNDGTVIGWGINEDGKTQAPDGLNKVVAVSAGEEHSLALKSDGTVVAWGRNQHGQASVPEGLTNVVSICSGSYFNLALKKDGTVVGWGIDVPKDLTNVTAIAAGPWDGMALKRDGRLVVWGQSYFSATQVPVEATNITTFSGGGNDYGDHSLALLKDGTIVGWGNNNFGQSVSPGILNGITSIAAGLGHYLAIKSDGSVIAWGGENHQGDGQAWVPSGIEDVKAIAGGWYHSLAVRDDGTVVGWGFGTFGQTSPPGDLSNVVAVTTAYNHSLALKQNGTVVGWGNPGLAQVPVGLSNVVAVAAGTGHNLALKNDGTVLGWGAGGSIQTDLPNNLNAVISIAVGGEYAGDHNLALKQDGTIVAWGSNNAGQTNLPMALTNVIAIAAGANHSLALKKDGTVVAWGDNSAGQSTVPRDLKNVVAVSAGGLSSAVIVVAPVSALATASTFAIRGIWISVILVMIFLFVIGFVWFVFRRRA